MNGKKARAIRALVYGEYSPRARTYKRYPNGQIVADDKRTKYQHAKKSLTNN
jgi:hypothetical protein